MPLPAPYAPPWKRLGEDLVATLAWLGLKLRELVRRNGEGSLPVPGFWPRRWPQLFWPLVLGASLVVPTGLVMGLRHQPPSTPLEASTEANKKADVPDVAIPLELPAPAEPMAEPEAPEDKAPEELDGDREPEPVPEADGLLAEWSEGDPVGLLEAIRADPDNATLTLQASGSFLALSEDNRLGQAERWRARATDWGYSHL
ncbi:MAG: hypothetical protein ACKOOC_06890, partial [Cyanobium sp.]